MGRPSSLSDRQWAEIGRRLAAKDYTSIEALGEEYGVSKATISRRFSKRIETVRELGTTLATVEAAIEELPISEQCSVRDFADSLKGISKHAAKAAEAGMKTANILHERALKTVENIGDDSKPEDLRMADACLTVAGKASSLGVSLMQANKDAAKDVGQATLGSLLSQTRNGG